MLADLRIELLRDPIAHIVDAADDLAPWTRIDTEADAQIELALEGHAFEVHHVRHRERLGQRLHDDVLEIKVRPDDGRHRVAAERDILLQARQLEGEGDRVYL